MSDLPGPITDSIAIVNADSIGLQPAILSNLALANQIFNCNLQQQIMLTQQQVMNQLLMATLARCVSLITTSFPGNADAREIAHSLEALANCVETLKKIGESSGSAAGNGVPHSPLSAAISEAAPARPAERSANASGPSPNAPGLPPEVVANVGTGNVKSIAEQPAMLSNLAYSNSVSNANLAAQNAVANQQALNELGVSVLGKTVNVISNLGPVEAKAAQEILTGNSLAELIADLKAALANFNSGNKTG